MPVAIELTIPTSRRTDFINITKLVRDAVAKSKTQSGTCLVFVPHTTAGITINENADPDVVSDIKESLDSLIPWDSGYKHSEGNSAAHIKASLMGSSVNLIIEDSKLVLGVWQGVYFCEFDGPRSRKVFVKVSS